MHKDEVEADRGAADMANAEQRKRAEEAEQRALEEKRRRQLMGMGNGCS